MPMFMIYSDYQTLVEVDDIPKYVTVYAERLGWEYSSDLSSGDISQHVRLNPVSCSQMINKTGSGYDYLRNNMTSYTEYVIDSGGLCFDLDDIFTVVGNQMDYVYYTFTLHVKPCSLDDGCATREELAPANFYVVTSQTHFQASDFEHPIKTIPNYDFLYYINTAANQIYTSLIKENIVSDYRGLPPSWTERKRFYDIKDTFLNLGMRDPAVIQCDASEVENIAACPSYFQYIMQSSTSVTLFARTYKTIVQCVAEIGGINQFAYTVIFLLYLYYNLTSREKYLVNKVYGIYKSKKILAEEMDGKQNICTFSETLKPSNLSQASNSVFIPHLDPNKNVEGVPNQIEKSDSDKQKTIHEKITSSRWFLCRKKSKKEKIMELKERVAFESLNDSLNIENIVLELNRVKVLCHCLFAARHFYLSPDVLLNLSRRKEVITAKKNAKRKNEMGAPSILGRDLADNDRYMSRQTEEELAKALTFSQAISQIQAYSKPNSGTHEPDGPILKELDNFYAELLNVNQQHWVESEIQNSSKRVHLSKVSARMNLINDSQFDIEKSPNAQIIPKYVVVCEVLIHTVIYD